MRDYFNTSSPVRFVYPIDGDCLNIYDGAVKDGFLSITATVKAPYGADISLDEKKADYTDGLYTNVAGVRVLRDHGYTGAHLSEVMFEGYRSYDAPVLS